MVKYTRFYPRIRSKNHSVNGLRKVNRGLPALPVKSIVRFGSTTPTEEIFRYSDNVVEINEPFAINNSRSKLKMKECFKSADVNQSNWYTLASPNTVTVNGDLNSSLPFEDLSYPLVAKRVFGYKAKGMRLIEDTVELEDYIAESSDIPWYLESYHNYVREYRLHCTEDGCFYACRKMLKNTAEVRWFRNDSNSVWILEENPLFDKPVNWSEIEDQCVQALKATRLDVGAFDVRVQSSKKEEPHFIIIEVNSAPAFGDNTERKYKEILPELILKKAKILNLI